MKWLPKKSSWNLFKNKKPEKDRLLLIWRYERRKYAVASYFIGQSKDEEGNWEYWCTQHGMVHVCNPEDVWLAFPPFSREEIYN